MTREQRQAVALAVIIATFIGGFAVAGYFLGIEGIGYGFPAAIAVGGIAAALVALAVVISLILGAVGAWIDRGN